MDTAKKRIPDDPEKTIVLPQQEDDKTIVLSADALNKISSIAPEKQKEKNLTENLSYTWFHGSRDVNALISEENRSRLGKEEENPLLDVSDPALISKDLLYLKSRDFNAGGQGILSEQQDRALGRTIAVKSLRKELLDKPESRASFIREAQISARLEHPSIIPVYSLTGDDEKGLHLAMKLIKGMTLSDYLKEIRFHYEKDGLKCYNEGKTLLYRLDLFLRICDALAYAHSRNIMHRDLKPENIIIGTYREIYVMDWGIARHIVQSEKEKQENSKSLWGTPVFMSPEMLRGEECDQRADIYALGMILFEMVYLKPGISGKTLQEILEKARNSRLETFRHRFDFPISPELTAIIRKAVHPDLNLRYQTVEEFSQDLRRFLAGDETMAKPDHLVGKILRSMSHHRKTVALLMILLLLGFITDLAFSFYKQRNEANFRRRYEHATTLLTFNAATTAYEIEQQLLSLGMLLQLFCEELTVRLNNPPMPGKDLPVPFMRKGQPLPAGVLYSPHYKSHLNFEHFGYFLAKEKGDAVSAQKEIRKVAPMLRKTEERFLKCALKDDTLATFEERKKQFALHGGAMVWMYFGMENGLYLQYPSSDVLPGDYDPRKRPWYLTGAMNESERLMWSKPYRSAQTKWLVITGTKACRWQNGELAGVAGFDVSLQYFDNIIDRYSTDSRFTRGKYVLDSSGNILAAADRDSDSVWGGSERIAETVNTDRILNVRDLNSNRMFEKIRMQKSGIITETTDKGTLLYIFFPIRTMRWTYVEVVAINDYLTGNEDAVNATAH